MIQVSEERVEQHFPTTVLVRTFQAVNDLNTAHSSGSINWNTTLMRITPTKRRFRSTPPKGAIRPSAA